MNTFILVNPRTRRRLTREGSRWYGHQLDESGRIVAGVEYCFKCAQDAHRWIDGQEAEL